jgi:hypothetical protein
MSANGRLTDSELTAVYGGQLANATAAAWLAMVAAAAKAGVSLVIATGDGGRGSGAYRNWVLANAAQFGFTRTFGEADPNHFGHDGTTVASFNLTPLENDMTDEQANQLANIYNAIFKGGPSMADQGKSVQQSLADINGTVSRNVQRAGADVTQIQDNADTNTMVRALLAQVAAQDAAIKAIVAGTGADPAAIQAAAKAGAADALASLNFTVTANQ